MSDTERDEPALLDVAAVGAGDAESSVGERVGLVLSGAAARGPYQAGAVAELIPALLAAHQRPVVILGTSSGALNAALLAQFANDGTNAGERIVDTWLEIGTPFDNAWLSLARKTAQMTARGCGVSALSPVRSLLDTGPLIDFAKRKFDPDRLTGNIRPDLVEAVGVAATWCPPQLAAARTRLFVQSVTPCHLSLGHSVDVVNTPLNVDHLLASAAIPAVFPPVKVTAPADYEGDYIDGGVRLNTPIQAALALGVTRLLVVSGHSIGLGSKPLPAAAPGQGPDLAASLAISLRAVLTDGLADDMDLLKRHNQRAQNAKRVPYRLVAPKDGTMAKLAANCARRYRWRFFNSYFLIRRLLAAAGSGIGPDELLSLILFEQNYFKEQIEIGRKHARAALDGPWQF
jgi:NTE family protein